MLNGIEVRHFKRWYPPDRRLVDLPEPKAAWEAAPTSGRSVLPVDTAVARCCARLHVPVPRAERDALIAATALVHRLRMVTRNVADFEPMGIELLDPWQ